MFAQVFALRKMQMDNAISSSVDPQEPKSRWLAAGGFFGAFLASVCCIAPLVLVTIGISGAWIANLTAMEPFKNYIGFVALTFIGFGFYQVYFKPKVDCVEGSYCARPYASLTTKTILWISAALVLLSLTVDYWAPLFY